MSAVACDICGAENALAMLTFMPTGDVTAIGQNCAVAFFAQTAGTLAHMQEHPLSDALGRVFEPPAETGPADPVHVVAIMDENGRDTGRTEFVPHSEFSPGGVPPAPGGQDGQVADAPAVAES